jgi:hypothetical protein
VARKAVPEMSDEQIQVVKLRLKRVLGRVGWTPHLWHKHGNCWYARAAKKDEQGQWHGKYIAPLHRISEMETGQIVAVLPTVA